MMIRLAMYKVRYLHDGQEVEMRVPQDQVDQFIKILMMNGVRGFSADVEDE